MKLLIIGSGGREHALAIALAGDPAVTQLHVAPGNAGTGLLAQNHEVAATDPLDVVALAVSLGVDLVVIGPEAPLVAGVADAVRAVGIDCFGPSAQAARLEGSKTFAKEVMVQAGVPTARARTCATLDEVSEALSQFGAPHVVKDDGLAAGKGVVVTDDPDAALAHAAQCLAVPGARVVVEDYLSGPELSLFAITDGTTAVPLIPAQDFKRVGDGDTGPNTGGMGAYAPLPWAGPELVAHVMETVVRPTIDTMARRGTPFAGLLYAGLALTPQGPRVVEFNARFGDPETQVVLALLETPLGGLLQAAARGELAAHPPLRWHPGAAVTVVLAAPGYPQAPSLGGVINGVPELGPASQPPAVVLADADAPAWIVHAGTGLQGSELVATGGRVLCATARGADLTHARQGAYDLLSLIELPGGHYRRDIALAAAQADGQHRAGPRG